MAKASYRQIGGPYGLLANHLPFEGNSMRGEIPLEWETQYSQMYGQMPADEVKIIRDNPSKVVYWVKSYATPIAVVFEDGSVYVPDVKYSVTTSRQQTLCRAWL